MVKLITLLIVSSIFCFTFVLYASAQESIVLLDENVIDVIQKLNQGGGTATKAAGIKGEALRVTAEGADGLRFNPNMPGWSFKIVEKPQAKDEFRYLSWWWKKEGGTGVQLQLHGDPGSWGHRYHAGKNVRNWTPSVEVSNEIPKEWTRQTADLFLDWKGFTLTGVAFTSWDGIASFWDFVVLHQTEKDPAIAVLFPAAATNAGSVSGRLSAAATGLPVKGAKVSLEEVKSGIVVATAISADDGSFKASNVPAASYRVVVQAEGFVVGYFGGQSRLEAKPITVTANLETKDVNIALLGKGGISGKVVLESRGSPIEGVQIVIEDFETGERVFETSSQRDGSYKITDLWPGRYRVSANPPSHTGLLREYFDNQSYLAPSKATPVIVDPDKETANVNFSLSVGGSISGVVEDLDGIPLGNVRLKAIDVVSGTSVAETSSLFDGSYRISGLPTSSYEVLAKPPSDTGFASLYYKNASKEIDAVGVQVVAPKSSGNIDFKFSKPVANLKFITPWLALGPFKSLGLANKAIAQDYLLSANGETEVIPALGDIVEYEGEKFTWTLKEIPPGGNNINDALSPKVDINDSTAYFAVYLRFAKAQIVDLIAGSDDAVAIWLNGRQVWFNPVFRGWGPDQDKLKVNVREGWNLLLVKVSEGGGSWAFSVQLPSDLLLEASTKKQFDKFPPSAPNSVVGYLTRWLALAPLTGVGNDDQTIIDADLLKSSGGEEFATPANGDAVLYKGMTLNWEVRDLAVSGDNLSQIYGANRSATAYLASYVRFPASGEVSLWLGSDDSISAILNGKTVWKKAVKRGLNVDQDKIVVQVKEGWNLLLLKVSNTGGGPWAFSARFPFLEVEVSLDDKMILMQKPKLVGDNIVYANGDSIRFHLLAESGAKVSVDISSLDNTKKIVELKESQTQPGLYEGSTIISSQNTAPNGVHRLSFKAIDRASNEASATLEAILSNPSGPIGPESVLTASLSLKFGLNLVSLPLKPDAPMTARSLSQKLGASLVVEYDKTQNRFSAFVPQIATNQGFEIKGGFGYIVNLLAPVEASFSGTAWRGRITAPPLEPEESPSIWAFVVGGIIHPEYGSSSLPNEDLTVQIKNRSRGIAQMMALRVDDEGRFAVPFVDLGQKGVVKLGDYFEIAVFDPNGQLVSGPVKHRVDRDDLQKALSLVNLKIGEIIPDKNFLGQNYPNPFNPETWIPFRLKTDSEVSLQIYDISGRLVKEFRIGYLEAGVYENRSKAIYWDGRNDYGERVASGIYYYRLQADNFSSVRKLALLK